MVARLLSRCPGRIRATFCSSDFPEGHIGGPYLKATGFGGEEPVLRSPRTSPTLPQPEPNRPMHNPAAPKRSQSADCVWEAARSEDQERNRLVIAPASCRFSPRTTNDQFK